MEDILALEDKNVGPASKYAIEKMVANQRENGIA